MIRLTLPFEPSPGGWGDACIEYLEVLQDVALPFKQSSSFDGPFSPEDALNVLNSTLSIYTYLCCPVPLSLFPFIPLHQIFQLSQYVL